MSSRLSYIAFYCALIFLVDVLLIHFIQTDFDWMSNTLSEYALGEQGYIINIGFYCIAATQLAIAALLISDPHFRSVLSPVLLIFAGVGALLVAIFPVQPLDASVVERLPHTSGAIIQFCCFPLALWVGKRGFQAHRLHQYTRFTARITMLLFAVLLALFVLKSSIEFEYFGALEKLDILLITFWLLAFSFVSMRKFDSQC